MILNLAYAVGLIFSYQTTTNPSFLKGTWQIENKQQFEVWTKQGEENLSGFSYKMKSEEKVILETLSIVVKNGQIIYQATVPNQNQGKTIQFTLNPKVKNKLSFENLSHDFPKKIQYTQLSESQLFVEVLGANDQGFSYKMIRQDG